MNVKFASGSQDDFLISSYFSTDLSSLVCTIKAEQKGENDTPVEVVYNNLEDRYDLKELVKNAIEYSILEQNCTTKFLISFHALNDGYDVFSLAINAYTSCAILAGIRIKDTLAAHTLLLDGCLCTVIYMLHTEKVLGFYLDGECCLEAVDKCIVDCRRNGGIIKDIVRQQIDSIS
ncbi:hypothetical protein NGRA_1936 [Nosema granulosis]|uniref:Uncharacterized protein n=1 Tax=Nosema granulosis TaxID=83296 RepID=A0A9P6KY62_9MICR|nr:hypothetical protein NGRA_1936 [Nosema granulosis]